MFKTKSSKKIKNSSRVSALKQKKRFLIILAAFIIVGVALLVRSFAATNSDAPYLSAAYVNTSNAICQGNESGCNNWLTKDKYNGRTVFNIPSDFIIIVPNEKTSLVNLDSSVKQLFCVNAKGKAQLIIDPEGAAQTMSFDSTDSYSTSCQVLGPTLLSMPALKVTGSIKITSYAIYYHPGYSTHYSFEGSELTYSSHSSKDPNVKSSPCKKVVSNDSGPLMFLGTASFKRQTTSSIDCSNSRLGGSLRSPIALRINPNAEYKLCVKARNISGPVGAYIANAFNEVERASATITLSSAEDVWNGWTTSCTETQSIGSALEYDNYVLGRLVIDFPPSTNAEVAEAYLITKRF